MKKNSIFRDELPGEKKSIINLLMTGYIVVISCLGYAAFFLYVQLGVGMIVQFSSCVSNSIDEGVGVRYDSISMFR